MTSMPCLHQCRRPRLHLPMPAVLKASCKSLSPKTGLLTRCNPHATASSMSSYALRYSLPSTPVQVHVQRDSTGNSHVRSTAGWLDHRNAHVCSRRYTGAACAAQRSRSHLAGCLSKNARSNRLFTPRHHVHAPLPLITSAVRHSRPASALTRRRRRPPRPARSSPLRRRCARPPSPSLPASCAPWQRRSPPPPRPRAPPRL